MMRALQEPNENLCKSSALVSKKNESSTYGDQRGSRRNKQPWCDHCQRPWQTQDTCWKIERKSTNWKPKKAEQGKGEQGLQVTSEEANFITRQKNNLNIFTSFYLNLNWMPLHQLQTIPLLKKVTFFVPFL